MSNNLNQGASIEAERALFMRAYKERYPTRSEVDAKIAFSGGDAGQMWLAARRSVPPAAGGLPPPELEESIDTPEFLDLVCSWRDGITDGALWSDIIDRINEYALDAIAADRAQRKQADAPASAQPAEYVRDALQCIHDTFKRDLDAGYKTKDKEFAVSVAAEALGAQPDQRESAAEGVMLSKGECDTALRWLDVTRLYAFTEPDDDALADKLAAAPSPAEQPVAKEEQATYTFTKPPEWVNLLNPGQSWEDWTREQGPPTTKGWKVSGADKEGEQPTNNKGEN
jgi:hypothetical protein